MHVYNIYLYIIVTVLYLYTLHVYYIQTAEEFAKIYLSKINMANSTRAGGSKPFPFTGKEAVPDEVDWRTKGVVTEVKNQVCSLNYRIYSSSYSQKNGGNKSIFKIPQNKKNVLRIVEL